ncbi:MAG: hypothetical protein SNH73_01695 [Rikenellaceae bacterium]
MKNNTSIIVSLLGGIVLGSAVTCILRDKCKMGKHDIHKKIMDELEQLRSFVAAHHSEEICSCEDPACNCPQE